MADAQSNDGLSTSDSVDVKITRGVPRPKVKPYRVTEKTVRAEQKENYTESFVDEDGIEMEQDVEIIYAGSEGIAKNGELFKPGDIIELDDMTAAGFLALEEIEAVDE